MQYEALFTPEAVASSVTISTLNESGLEKRIFIDNLEITQQVAEVFLYEGFEGAAFPPADWTAINAFGSESWERYTSNSPVGTASASVADSWDGGSSNWLITPKLEVGSVQTFSFQAKVVALYDNTYLYVKVSNTGKEISDFTVTKLTLTDEVVMPNTLTTSWQTFTINLSEYAGQNIYIAFHNVDSEGSRVMVDEVSGPAIAPTSSCMAPTALVASNITTNSATISWQDASAGNWVVEYSTRSDFSSDVNTLNVTATTCAISNFLPGKRYYVRVKADCLNGEYSDYVGLNFFTLCDAVNPYGWSDSFSETIDGDMPRCWTLIPANADYPTISWEARDGQDYVGKALEFYASSASSVNLITTPMFSGSLDSSQIYFYVKTGDATSEAVFELGAMSDPTDATTFMSIYNATPVARGTYEMHIADLINVPNTHRYLAFKMSHVSGTPTIYLDNVNVYKIPTCLIPQNTMVDDITVSSARIGWEESGPATQWKLQYTEYPSFNTDVHTVEVSTTPLATISGLEANTRYYVRVKAVCSETEESFWGATTSFVTLCGEYKPLNWRESFQNYSEDDAMPECWTRAKSYVASSVTYPYVSVLNSNDNLGGGLLIYGQSLIATPRFSGTLSGSEVTFFAKKASAGVGDLQFGAMTDAGDPQTFTSLTPVSIDTEGEWVKFTVALDQLDSTYRHLAFYNNVSDSVMQRFYVDKIDLHPIPNCVAPTNLTVVSDANITGGGFVVDATSSVTPQAWDIEYVLSGSTDATIVRVSSMPYTVANVGAGRTFQVRVRLVCDSVGNYYLGSSHSDWTSWVEVSTVCLPVSLPYYIGFDDSNSNMSGGFGCLTRTGQFQDYDCDTDTYITYPAVIDEGNSDPKSLFMSFYADEADSDEQAVIFPEFIDPLSDAVMTFYAKRTESVLPSHIEVRALTNVEDTTPIVIHSIPSTDVPNAWTSFRVAFTNIPNTHSLISLAIVTDSDLGIPEYKFDNILIEVAQGCEAPMDFRVVSAGDTYVSLSWASISGETEWMIDYKAAAATDWTSITVQTDTNTTITGLTASTAYEAKIKAICSEGDESRYTVPISFTTDCPAVAAINEDFNSTATRGLPDCWRVISAEANYPSVANAESSNGVPTKSVKFMNSKPQYLVAPKLNRPLNEIMLKFDLNREGASSGLFQVGVMSNPDDATTFVPVLTLDNRVYKTLVSHEALFAGITDDGNNRYIAFRYGDVDEVSVNTMWYYWLDNVMTDTIPDCMHPSSVAARNVQSDRATIVVNHQLGANSFNYAYTTDMTVTDPSTLSNADAASATFVINGLVADTEYKVWVRTSCNGTYSSWVNTPARFRTPCEPIAQSIGYTENFDAVSTTGYSLPDCWRKISTVNYPYVIAPSTSDGLSSNSVRFSGSKPQFLVMQKMSAPLNTLLLRFNLVKEGYRCGQFQVGVMSDQTDASTFVPVATLDNGTTYKQKVLKEVDFTSVVDDTTNRYIAFRYGDVDEVSQTTSWYYWIDDVEILALPSCLPVQNLRSTSASQNSVSIAFAPREGQTSWQYTISSDLTLDVPDANATYSMISTDIATIGGLQPNSTYKVWVRAICSANDSSDWTQPLQVRTDCGVSTIPYFESFADLMPASSNDLYYCWTRVTSYSDFWGTQYPLVNNLSSYDSIGNGIHMLLAAGVSAQIIASPEFASLNNTEVSMWVKRLGSGAITLEFGVMSDVADASTFVSLGSITPANTDEWVQFDVPMQNISPMQKYFAYATTAAFPMVTGDTLSFTTMGTGLDLAESSVSIYPNPAKDEVSIEIDGLATDATATIYDMLGEAVGSYTVPATTGKATVDVSAFADGTYLVRIVSKDINRVERLIIKR